ncbi:precorrin-3B synthase [Rhizobium sp. 18055]|uniref:precorrin-3B synthase n=1 Tax=Rhizobium sp. 18055 TaxID=2681403 RepID=UPI00135A247D|nr:precorrin-3B synthase [Rhizobium sp. 18055]
MALGKQMETDVTEAAAQPFARRGACPTLAQPMQTGDGLLARLRPQGGILTIRQFEQLAHAAQRYGNGLLEITARGSLQIRGLSQETVEPFAEAVDAAGIIVPPNPVIELSPLHGAEFGDVAGAAAMEQRLRTQLAELLRSPGLAPKLAVIIEGGGRFGLADVSADIRLLAVSADIWLVAIAGDGHGACPIAVGSADEAIDTVGTLLRLLLSIGWQRRCRDIEHEQLLSAFPQTRAAPIAGPEAGKGASIGIHYTATDQAVIGLKPRFGQLAATDLLAFLSSAEGLGIREVRPAPARGFFLNGLTRETVAVVRQLAERHGLSANGEDISSHIATCAGAGACASGFYATKAVAEAVIERCPDVLDGSLVLHLSGCAKGCAHPKPALTLAGTSNGYSLVLDGLASDAPDTQIAGSEINSAIERLARLIKNQRQAGESARACLGRLGKDNVTRALRQE